MLWERIGSLLRYQPDAPMLFSTGLFFFLFIVFFLVGRFFFGVDFFGCVFFDGFFFGRFFIVGVGGGKGCRQ